MLKRVSLLAAGNVLGQAFQLAAQPLLARMYPAEAFGQLGQIIAVSTAAVVVATLQMHTAVVLPRQRDEATSLFSAGLLASTLLSIVAAPVLLLARHDIFGGGAPLWAAWSCTLLLHAVSYSNLVKGWQTATGAFAAIAIFSLVRAAALVGVQLAFGALRMPHGLLVGAIAGEWVAMLGVVSLRGLPRGDAVLAAMRPRVAWRSLARFRDFALFGTVQELVAVVALMLPLYMFTAQYTAAIGGQFAMAHRIVWAPAMLVGSALAQVLYHHLAQEGGMLSDATVLAPSKPMLLIVAGAAAGMWVAPAALTLVLGGEWVLAAELSRWLILWAASYLLCVPYRVCYRVLRLQRVQLLVDGAAATFSLVALLNARHLSPLQMAVMVAAAGAAQNATLAGIIMLRLRSTRAAATEAP